jgi:antitoxin (DNA-binding transcriptional repressor) of toxin-antitoxin stability system
MATVSVRDLRNHGGDVLDRVSSGEHVIVTRGGRPVAELRALTVPAPSAEVLIDRWRHLPPVDPEEFRAGLDELLDQRL